MSTEQHDDAAPETGAAADAASEKAAHPGAAFGIPEGATGEEVVDAVFGDAVATSGGLEALRREIEGDPAGIKGIDPELLPYIEAAGGPTAARPDGSTVSVSELQSEQAAAEAAEDVREAADLDALRHLVAHNMIPAGDLDQLDALLAEVDDDSDDWEDWEPQLPDGPADRSDDADWDEQDGTGLGDEIEAHQADLRAAAHAVEVSARMREVEAEILARAPEHQVQPSLERVEAVLDLLGNPERSYRVVHVTGTNGKTSTARMVERLLAATGMRTGRFTSPHLATIRERISLDGEPVSQEGFVAAWEDVAPYVEMVDEQSLAKGGPRLSFFEVLTVMAFAAFADHPVDVAVIEVGMGGTWDSTNVVQSEVEVITPIGLDHTAWLGDTIEEIAGNKAGIIKDGATLITSVQVPEAQAVIAAAAAEHGVVWRRELDPEEDPDAADAGALRVLDRSIAVGGQLVTMRTAAAVYEDVFVPLHGDYQASNALLALAAAEAVFGGRALPAKIVEDGFASVTSPGRLEVVRSSPTVLVDAGHNPHGVTALMSAIDEAFPFQHLVAVYGAMADKDAEGVLAALEPAVDAVVIVPIDSPRAAEPEDLAVVAREVLGDDRVIVASDLGSGVEQAVTIAEGADAPLPASGVLIVGSVVLAAEARALFGRV